MTHLFLCFKWSIIDSVSFINYVAPAIDSMLGTCAKKLAAASSPADSSVRRHAASSPADSSVRRHSDENSPGEVASAWRKFFPSYSTREDISIILYPTQENLMYQLVSGKLRTKQILLVARDCFFNLDSRLNIFVGVQNDCKPNLY